MQKSPPRSIPPALRDLMPATAQRSGGQVQGDGAKSPLKAAVTVLVVALGVMWAMEILDTIIPVDFDQWGIQPRSISGLFGILLAPILHGGFGHLISNSIPFFILGGLVMLRGGVKQWVSVTAVTAVVGGLLVWLVASSSSVHIGASGVIFGYFGYLLARGIFERSIGGILIAVVVIMLYGGFIWGVLPSRPGVSWEGHLFGALSGAGWAWLTRPKKAAKA